MTSSYNRKKREIVEKKSYNEWAKGEKKENHAALYDRMRRTGEYLFCIVTRKDTYTTPTQHTHARAHLLHTHPCEGSSTQSYNSKRTKK